MDAKTNKNKLNFLILIFAIALIWFLGRHIHIDKAGLQRYLGRFPLAYAGIAFVILYVIITFFVFFSNDIFRFTGALLFGAYISTLFVLIAEIINAFILFYLARYLGRSFVEESFGGKYNNLDEKLGRVNFAWLFLFRSVPFIPFRFLDLGAGLTKISFRRYLAAVILGSPLRIFWLQYVLAGAGQAVFNQPRALREFLLRNKAIFLVTLVYLVLIIVVAFKLKRKG